MKKIDMIDILGKIIGTIVCGVGIGIWYIDYIIFTAIGALTAWIASIAGITGTAILGVQIIGWVLALGVMVSVLIIGLVVIIIGIGMILQDE
jgi:hypothetical protein